eukprot:259809-Chlamydomonas_euryale.AAC.1
MNVIKLNALKALALGHRLTKGRLIMGEVPVSLAVGRADSLVSIFSNMKLVRRAAEQAALVRHADVLLWTWTAMNYEEDIPEELEEESEDTDVASDSSAGSDAEHWETSRRLTCSSTKPCLPHEGNWCTCSNFSHFLHDGDDIGKLYFVRVA